jgi:peptidoglycan/xylan/chitin deacetylase (PgdA/CDA1 family)
MFRAPYGAWSPTLLDYIASENLAPLDWSVDPKDWTRPGVSKIVKAIMGTTKTGSIILEHDGGGDRSETVAALKIAIPRLIDEGYMFTVP